MQRKAWCNKLVSVHPCLSSFLSLQLYVGVLYAVQSDFIVNKTHHFGEAELCFDSRLCLITWPYYAKLRVDENSLV